MPLEAMPPVMPLPEAFKIPYPDIAPPVFQMPKWEPVPIKPEDIPALNPKPAGDPSNPEEVEEEPQPKPIEERLDDIQEMMTPTPPLPLPLPEYDYVPEPAEKKDSQVNTVEILGQFEIPVPKQEIVVTAVTTAGAAAVASVGATMIAGKAFDQVYKIAKPAIKAGLNKVAKARGKPPALTWARQRLVSRLHTKDKTG